MLDATPQGPGGGCCSKASDSEDLSTNAASSYSSSQCSTVSQGWTETIAWEELKFGNKIQQCRGYAHCAADVRLASCVLDLLEIPDVDVYAIKLLLRALRFLRLCDYSVEDICSILAHATSYFSDAFALCGDHMDECEVGNVLVTLMFIAHCYVQDETCPLHVWHKHLFRKYCHIHVLSAAILRLMEIRTYILRVGEEEIAARFQMLLGMANKHGRPVSSSSDYHSVLTSQSIGGSSSSVASPSVATSDSLARGLPCPPHAPAAALPAKGKEPGRDGSCAAEPAQPAILQSVPFALVDVVTASARHSAVAFEARFSQKEQSSTSTLLQNVCENFATEQ